MYDLQIVSRAHVPVAGKATLTFYVCITALSHHSDRENNVFEIRKYYLSLLRCLVGYR